MTAVTRPLYIERGATFTLGFNWHRESDPPTSPKTAGVPYDLTGCTARMQIRKNAKSPALLEVSSDGVNPVIELGGDTGRVDIRLPATSTDLLITPTAVYEFEIVMLERLPNDEPDVRRLFEGSVTVK